MKKKDQLTNLIKTKYKYLEIGICGLSCRLCPAFQRKTKSKCSGCKSEGRIKLGCTFIRSALKNKGVEFCWLCKENHTCEKWKKHRAFSKKHDSFVCYQKLEDNIAFIRKKGIQSFKDQQNLREKLLREMLTDFNEGRSKSYFCITSTIFDVDELKEIINQAEIKSKGLDIKSKSKILHSLLDQTAQKKKYNLKLRKKI
jgi:hypothetical protein